MPGQSQLRAKVADAARAAWVEAARDILIAEGIHALNLRRLSRRLGVTTGAFYSVFSGLEDLHEALREKWRNQNAAPLIAAVTAAGEDGFRQYLAGLRVIVLEGGIDPRFDNAMREWTHSSPRTAEILAEVEAQRIDLLYRMFRALGFDEKRAQIRARLAHFHQIGYGVTEVREDLNERLLNLRYYAEALVGRDDLLACKTAEEVRHFILTGQPPEQAGHAEAH